MTKGKDIDMMSNSEIKLLILIIFGLVAISMDFLSKKPKTIFVMEEDALNANTSI